MATNENYNSDILDAARIAWNKLNNAMDDKPRFLYETDSAEFNEFYEVLISSLFDDTMEG